MKIYNKAVLIIAGLIAALGLSMFQKDQVHAAESEDQDIKSYEFISSYSYYMNNVLYYDEIIKTGITLLSGYDMVMYVDGHYVKPYCFYVGSSSYISYSNASSSSYFFSSKTYGPVNSQLNGTTEDTTGDYLCIPLSYEAYQISSSDEIRDVSLSSSVKIFSSYSAVENYLNSGDESGWLNKPEYKPDTSGAVSSTFSLDGVTVLYENDVIRADWSGISKYNEDDTTNDFVNVQVGFKLSSGVTGFKDFCYVPLDDGYVSINVSDLNFDSDTTIQSLKLVPYHYLGTDLLKGNASVRYFSGFKAPSKFLPSDWADYNEQDNNSLGYIPRVTYNIRTSTTYPYEMYDVIGWDTSLNYSDAYVEMMASIQYTVGASTVTSNQKFISHYDEINYKTGIYEFCLSDIFPDKPDVKVSYYYVRLSRYDDESESYVYGGWTRIDPHNLLSNNINTGYIDNQNNWNTDNTSDGSYSYGMGVDGTFEDPIDWSDVSYDKFEKYSFSWFVDMLNNIVSALGCVPALINTTLGYLPSAFTNIMGIVLIACVILRFMGR